MYRVLYPVKHKMLTLDTYCLMIPIMVQNEAMAKYPDSIPKEEMYDILTGSYKLLNKQNITIGLSEEGRRILDDEANQLETDRTKALEILLREIREIRKARQ